MTDQKKYPEKLPKRIIPISYSPR